MDNNKGIWAYKELFEYDIPENDRITLGEGKTPLDEQNELAKELGITSLYLKREDHNPTGSHKDRMTAFMMSAHLAFDKTTSEKPETQKQFVVSSSGNAAISAIRFAQIAKAKLYIFISPKTPQEKIERLTKAANQLDIAEDNVQIITKEDSENLKPKVFFTDRAVSDSIKFAKKYNLTLLRGSTDKYATQGFRTIAQELVENGTLFTDMFIPSSSGTTVLGIYEGYLKQNEQKIKLDPTTIPLIIPRFHVIQTETVHPISEEFDKSFTPQKESIAQAITDKVSHRKTEIVKVIKETNGFGWIVSDKEIKAAQEILSKYNVICSNEGAMTIAGIIKAKSSGWDIRSAVCIITGVRLY